jgi:hypothetical protein
MYQKPSVLQCGAMSIAVGDDDQQCSPCRRCNSLRQPKICVVKKRKLKFIVLAGRNECASSIQALGDVIGQM